MTIDCVHTHTHTHTHTPVLCLMPDTRNIPTEVRKEAGMTTKGRGAGGGLDCECGISRCKLLYITWINDKALLYSTGNYILYPVINDDGKEDEKEYMHN